MRLAAVALLSTGLVGAGCHGLGSKAYAPLCAPGVVSDTWPASAKADILFVIDDSSSMCEEQENLRTGFPSLLDGLDATGMVDFHIGVITTDTVLASKSGRLQNRYVAAVNGPYCMVTLPPPLDCFTGLPDPLPKILTRDTPDLIRTFNCISSVGIGGAGYEAPLAATILAASLADDPDSNAGFFRDDALLALVYVSDEDDCSVCNDPNWPGVCGYMPSVTMNLDCSIYQSDFRTWERDLADTLTWCRSGGRMIAAAIIGLDAEGMSQGPIYPDVDTVNHPGELTPICSSLAGRAVPAPRIERFVRRIDPDASVASICETDLAPRLEELGQRIGAAAAVTVDWCLSHPACTGGAFDAVLTSGGVDTTLGAGDYMLVPDPACAASGMRLELTQPLPAGATVRATYGTC